MRVFTITLAVSLVVALAMTAGLAAISPSPFAAVALERPIRDLPRDLQQRLPPEAAPGPEKDLYVALGDSFASGEGAPVDVYDRDRWIPARYRAFLGDPTDDGYDCHRSPGAYAVTLWRELGPQFALDLRACSGARFRDLHGRQNGEPPQLDALAPRGDSLQRPKLITMTMGGNDIGFAEIVLECILESGTASVFGADCRTGEDTFIQQLESLTPVLIEEYTRINSTLSADGRLVVLGYPQPFPVEPPGRCGSGVGNGFGVSITTGIRRENMLWLNSVATRLSEAIRDAAKATGATYVDVTDILQPEASLGDGDRHDACIDSANQRWINRTIFDDRNDPLATKWSWHPKIPAHRIIAARIKSCLDSPATMCESPESRGERSSSGTASPEVDLREIDPCTLLTTSEQVVHGLDTPTDYPDACNYRQVDLDIDLLVALAGSSLDDFQAGLMRDQQQQVQIVNTTVGGRTSLQVESVSLNTDQTGCIIAVEIDRGKLVYLWARDVDGEASMDVMCALAANVAPSVLAKFDADGPTFGDVGPVEISWADALDGRLYCPDINSDVFVQNRDYTGDGLDEHVVSYRCEGALPQKATGDTETYSQVEVFDGRSQQNNLISLGLLIQAPPASASPEDAITLGMRVYEIHLEPSSIRVVGRVHPEGDISCPIYEASQTAYWNGTGFDLPDQQTYVAFVC